MDLWQAFSDRHPENPIFVEDGKVMTSASLRSHSEILARSLMQVPTGRFAVLANRPSVLATCLLAAAQSARELLILRSPQEPDSDLLRAAGVGAVVEEQNLELHSTGIANTIGLRDAAILIPTSGTSGVPKIACHQIPALMGRIRPPRPQHGPARWLLTYQPNGFAGIQMMLTALATDSTLVCLSEINVPHLTEAALSHRVTHISGTPTFWRSFLLCLGDSAELGDLQQITLGGEVVDQATLDRLRARFPHAGISHIYASTEAGALFSVRDGRAGFPAHWLEDGVEGSLLRIREGVLDVKSPRSMLGYLNESNSAGRADGWLVTGDRAEQVGDRVYFRGRQDFVINIGGGKVTPEEVESALLDVPGVLDLRAYPVANPITGYVVGLEAVAAPATDIDQLRQRILAVARQRLLPYKVPRLIRFVEAVKCDLSGKKSRKLE